MHNHNRAQMTALLRYHLGLARLAVSRYPHKGDRLLALDPLERSGYQTFPGGNWCRYANMYSDADDVMNNGYEPGLFDARLSAWKRLERYFVTMPHLFLKYKVASEEEVTLLRNQMFPR